MNQLRLPFTMAMLIIAESIRKQLTNISCFLKLKQDEPLYTVANCYHKLDQDEKTIKTYQEGIKLYPKATYLYFWLALALQGFGRTQEGLRLLRGNITVAG